MSAADWVSSACALAILLVLGIVAVDRDRLRRRMDQAEGRVTALSLDLAATRELLTQVQSYLGSYESWDVGATAPSELRTAAPDRWSPSSRPSGAPAAPAREQAPTPAPPLSPAPADASDSVQDAPRRRR